MQLKIGGMGKTVGPEFCQQREAQRVIGMPENDEVIHFTYNR
jgi:hypothetical protein